MTDKRTQNLKNFLSELSGKAFAYLFPGVDKETLGERSHRYLKEYPPVFASYSKLIDLEETETPCIELGAPDAEPEAPYIEPETFAANPDTPKAAARKQSKRAKRTTRFLWEKRDNTFYDLYDGDLNQEDWLDEPAVPDLEPDVPDLEPDGQTKALLAEIEKLQRKYGITIEELEAVIAFRVKLSRLHITEKKAIVLEDFDHKEVKMDTLTKAVFLLYLKHPEGIRYKELSDYQQELEEIYSSITGREDLDSIQKSVADLCDPLNNSINEKVSKVKKAFRDAVDDRVARFYYIDGKKGTAKRIALDRDFVLWE